MPSTAFEQPTESQSIPVHKPGTVLSFAVSGSKLRLKREQGIAAIQPGSPGPISTLRVIDWPMSELGSKPDLRVERLSDATGEPLSKIGVTAKEIFAALNCDRRASGLPEIKDRTVVSRLLGRLVEGREIVKSGDNRRTEYKLRD